MNTLDEFTNDVIPTYVNIYFTRFHNNATEDYRKQILSDIQKDTELKTYLYETIWKRLFVQNNVLQNNVLDISILHPSDISINITSNIILLISVLYVILNEINSLDNRLFQKGDISITVRYRKSLVEMLSFTIILGLLSPLSIFKKFYTKEQQVFAISINTIYIIFYSVLLFYVVKVLVENRSTMLIQNKSGFYVITTFLIINLIYNILDVIKIKQINMIMFVTVMKNIRFTLNLSYALISFLIICYLIYSLAFTKK
jgi:hypothetical protein